jgi:hypothetical protein
LPHPLRLLFSYYSDCSGATENSLCSFSDCSGGGTENNEWIKIGAAFINARAMVNTYIQLILPVDYFNRWGLYNIIK